MACLMACNNRPVSLGEIKINFPRPYSILKRFIDSAGLDIQDFDRSIFEMDKTGIFHFNGPLRTQRFSSMIS